MAENPTPTPTPAPTPKPDREPERQPERAPAPGARGAAGALSDWDLLHPPMDASLPNPMPASSERLHEAAIEDPERIPGLGVDDTVMLGGVSGSTVTANVRTGPAQEAPRVVYDDAAASRDEWVFDATGGGARRASAVPPAGARGRSAGRAEDAERTRESERQRAPEPSDTR